METKVVIPILDDLQSLSEVRRTFNNRRILTEIIILEGRVPKFIFQIFINFYYAKLLYTDT